MGDNGNDYRQRNLRRSEKELADSIEQAASGKAFDKGGRTRIGDSYADTHVFSLKDRNRLVLGYQAIYTIEMVVADLAQKTNWVMDPGITEKVLRSTGGYSEQEIRILKRKIPKSKTYPIEPGDILQVIVTGVRLRGDDETGPIYDILAKDYEQAVLPYYEISAREKGSGFAAKPWYAHEKIRELMEQETPKMLYELAGLTEDKAAGVKLYAQVRQHIKASDISKKAEAVKEIFYSSGIDPKKLVQSKEESWGSFMENISHSRESVASLVLQNQQPEIPGKEAEFRKILESVAEGHAECPEDPGLLSALKKDITYEQEELQRKIERIIAETAAQKFSPEEIPALPEGADKPIENSQAETGRKKEFAKKKRFE
jgi:hypothetical protein